jgi:transposase InsO family protein
VQRGKALTLDDEVLADGADRVWHVPFRPDLRPSRRGSFRVTLAGEAARSCDAEAGSRCHEAAVRPSMGSAGDACDKGPVRFFATLECELLARRLAPQVDAGVAVFGYVGGCYNPVRLHSALGYRSPITYEQEQAQTAEAAAGESRSQAD